ncbi:phenylalanine--tRNA ligase subunit beta [Williamsia maris]|uniref:Phenylalanine--tRNA ligase beta subunit n=1 Tax=Williamsia maris TaxID=72806 RepID=A0ABT1HF45_9NOCA|nr:phenylalanine--tRNA ligase subunit beta [Williamsia maris]MCP2176849.1 phenylalanyl-tRNA synthetase beta subunit [Williamsia maris]
MRVPQSWLTESLQRGAADFAATTAQIDAGFVRVGFEIEDVEDFPAITGPLVVGRVAEITELTEFKKPIRFCQVDVGEDVPRGIVCGARNFAEGDLIVAALPGSVLPGDFAIAARKTYGHTSDGMICSVSELGIGTDHSGILVLAPGTAAPGTDAHDALGLSDTAIDVNVTPDRGYAFSVRGLARELAASFELPYSDPAGPDTQAMTREASDDAWPVRIDPSSGATRYCAQVIRGVDPTAVSPWWIQKRLLVAGVRPISAAVDVTNYVMLELGQPLHAFDSARVTGTIVVRRANAGEKLTTLDGVERALVPDDVVIADDRGPIALAGVMGGAESEISPATVDVILEAANFEPVSAFRTGRRHRLSSEAGKRFERTVDPEITALALARATDLITEIAGGVADVGYTDTALPVSPVTVSIAPDLPDRVAGVTYAPGTTVRRLEQVGATVSEGADGVLEVVPPSWRSDLRQSADLVEEVLRLEGLENIPAIPPRAPAGTGLTPAQVRRRSVGRALAMSGFVEVLPFPFMPADVLDLWDIPADDPRRDTVRVLNPLESSRGELNTTLLPGLVEMTVRNITRGQRDVALYTIGQVVIAADTVHPVATIDVTRRPSPDEIAELMGSLPHQPLRAAVVLAGAREPAGPWGAGRPVDASDAFDAARVIGRASGVELAMVAAEHVPWHPGRCARVVADDGVGGTIDVGWAGELHPALIDRAGLPPRTCAVELDLDLLPISSALPAPQLSLFPAVLQDVAVVVDRSVAAARVQQALTEGAGELLEDIRLYDVFTGPQLGDEVKSLTFALRFRASDRTLTEDDASQARLAAVDRAASELGARLR